MRRYNFKEQVKKSHNFYTIYRIVTKTSIQEENIQLIKKSIIKFVCTIAMATICTQISVAKSGILSRDLGIFLSSWDFIGIFILKTESRDFFGIFENPKFEIWKSIFYKTNWLPNNFGICPLVFTLY